MPELLTCPACGAQLRSSPDIPAGEDVRCPRCGQRFAPPPAPSPPAEPTPAAATGEPRPGEYAPEPIPPAPPPSGAARPETGYGEEGSLPPARAERAAGDEDDYDDDLPPARPGEWDGDKRAGGLDDLSDQYSVNMGEWFGHAKAHWGAVLGPMIGYYLIVQVISAIIGLIPHIGGIIQFFVVPQLQAGFVIVALAQLQGRPWTFGDFFNGFQKYVAILVYNILVGLCVAPFIIAAVVPIVIVLVGGHEHDQTAIFIAIVVALVFLVPAVYVGIRVGMFGLQLIFDRDFTGTEALQGSWRLTRGHVLELFGVQIVLGLMALAGVLALCVGFLFVIPFLYLTPTAGYLLIAGRRPPVSPDSYPREARREDYDDRRDA